MALQTLRDSFNYNSGYFQGRTLSLTESAWSLLGASISKVTSAASVPLPLLSFLALPFFGSTSTTISLAFFWLVWTTVVFRYTPIEVEIYGTLACRLLFFLLPSFLLLAFDILVPSLAIGMKAAGTKQLPSRGNDPQRLTRIAAIATLNTFLAVAIQAAFEYVLTELLHFRSALRVTTLIPTPWSVVKDVLLAIVVRGFAQYAIHRYVLHASPRGSPVANWHRDWAHSVRYPFSLMAAYDHPVCHLLLHWVPLYLPAVLFRYHVLTWHVLVALASIEQTLTYSGYAVMPSTILLSGIARRTDAHYLSQGKGNFGHWGVLDWVFGSTCPGEADIMEDLQDEAEKRKVKERLADAKQNARGLVQDAKDRFGKEPAGDVDVDVDVEEENDTAQGVKQRRSKRKGKNTAD